MNLIKLKVKGFKKIQEIELDLADVNILVGANGSGKSSILQLVHLGCCMIRQADKVAKDRTSTVGVEELDYLPTDEYKTLGHDSLWGNRAETPSSKLILTFRDNNGKDIEAWCELRSARNAGISISGDIPNELSTQLRQKKKFFSAYIPGISGVPNKEERRSKKIILKACSFGDSNVILRNALLLLKEKDESNIRRIEDWLSKIIGEVSIKVDHDEDKDLYVNCLFSYNNIERPIELAGTGFLQLIQIFCYVLLFAPGILLIDEPDTHLHPNVQEKLVGVLAEIAKEKGIKVLMTTHSPFIVRGTPVDANVYWLQDGIKSSENRAAVELAIGWGAFGKKIILVSEDSDTVFLRKIVSQWPDIERNVAFYPGNGFKNLPSPEQAKELCETLGGTFKIIVHRDRDSLTDREVDLLKQKYRDCGVYLWLPVDSDIESYFCTADFIAKFLNFSIEDSQKIIDNVLEKHSRPIKDQFNKHRASHNEEFYKEGGSPTNEDVLLEFNNKNLKGAKGKFVFRQISTEIGNDKFSKNKIISCKLDVEVASDLKDFIRLVLK